MCGIVGYLDRTNNEHAPVGCVILGMLDALGCRGPDSAGVAVFGPSSPERFAVRVKLGDHGDFAGRAEQVFGVAQSCGAAGALSTTGPYLRLEIDTAADPRKLAGAIENLHPEIEVVSIGCKLEIVKQVGSPRHLDESYGVSKFQGTTD